MATLSTAKWIAWYTATISLTKCNSGKIQKLPFRYNPMIELKDVTATSGNTGTLLS